MARRLDIFDIPRFQTNGWQNCGGRYGKKPEKNTFRPATLIPVFCKESEILTGKDRISVNPPFCLPDMDRHVRAGNIIIVKMDNFRYTQTGRIHGGNNCFVFENSGKRRYSRCKPSMTVSAKKSPRLPQS